MANLPTLYKKTSTGADQEWTITVEGATIVTRFGQVGGKIQETRDTMREGKNVGKSNETTPEQQAEFEAESTWTKKLKKGYVKTISDAREGKVDEIITGGYSPMLAHKYNERGDKIVFPAYIQPKLDGHRCTADVAPSYLDQQATLWSRTRKPITSMPHVTEALEQVFINGALPDGELYNHEYHNKFDELTHFIRSPNPEPGYEIVQYHIYDVNMPGTFEERLNWLRENLGKSLSDDMPLKLVETIEVQNEDEMMLAFERFNSLGYEGAIVRNANGPYVGKRSVDLQKLKTFEDAEFKVVGVEEGRGKLTGHAIFICEMPDTKVQFRAKMRGVQEELKKYFDDPALAVGRSLTIKYQGMTNKNNVPRFPVAWRFADSL